MKLRQIATALLLACTLSPALHADTAAPAAAVDKAAIKAQLQGIEAQIKAIRDEIKQFNGQKASLWDQVSTLRNQKHLADLQKRLDDLTAKLAAAQAKSNTAKVAEITGRQGVLQQELAKQQDISALLVKLQAAHAALDTATAKALDEQIKADREAVKALYPPKPASLTPVATAAVTPGIAPTPKPEDPAIQSLMDQIHALEGRIKDDQAKIEALKQQADALKAQLKALKK